jgi:CAAX protease family protein
MLAGIKPKEGVDMSEQEPSSASVSMKNWIAGHPVAAFLLLLYPVSWILFLPALLGKSGLGAIPIDIPPQISLLLVTLIGAIGLVFLVTRIADGKAGTRALRRHYYQFRAAPQWYLAAVFGPLLVLLTAGLVTHGTAVLGPIAANIGKVPTMYLLPLAMNVVLVGIWEEGMWMAFVTDRLQKRVGPVLASIVVAPCFGFVHIPLFFIVGGLTTTGRLPLSQLPLYAFILLIGFSVQVRILVTWLYNSTGGSLPVAALFHQSMDLTASAAVLAAFYPWSDGNLLYIGFAVVAVALIAATRGQLGYRAEQTLAPKASRIPVTMAAVAGKS